jgi:hypothetical protein
MRISSILEINYLFVTYAVLEYKSSVPLEANVLLSSQEDKDKADQELCDFEKSGNLEVVRITQEDFNSNLHTIITLLEKLRESLSVEKHKD